MYLATRFTLLLAAARELRTNSRNVWRWFSWAWRCAFWALICCLQSTAFVLLAAYMGLLPDAEAQRQITPLVIGIFQHIPPIFWLALLFCTNSVFANDWPKIKPEK